MCIRDSLYNLIDNGMKASGEGQTLRVFCEKSEQTLTVAVEDQGIGMSPEEDVYKRQVLFQEGREDRRHEPRRHRKRRQRRS